MIIVDCVLPESERAALETALLAMSKAETGVSTNQARGYSFFDKKWLSADDLHKKGLPGFDTLLDTVNGLGLGAMYVFHNCWAIVAQRGMSGKPHSHQGELSCAYYVNAGDSGSAGGELVIHKSRSIQRLHTPRSNQLVMFPSDTVHSVKLYDSDAIRIVMPFNLRRT